LSFFLCGNGIKPVFFFSITKKARNEKETEDEGENEQEHMPEKHPFGRENTGNMANAF
jgi:hypothetical protein